jgi:hypothetical protein
LKLKQEGEKKALKGEYISSTNPDLSFNVEDIRIKDNKLLFTISGEFNNSKFTADYTVLPRGDKFAGKVAYNLGGETGELEVAATREPQAEKQ